MKTPTIPYPFYIPIAVFTLGISVLGLAFIHDYCEQPSYPLSAPAGFEVVTDGSRFSFSRPYRSDSGIVRRSVWHGEYDSACEAIRTAWLHMDYVRGEKYKAEKKKEREIRIWRRADEQFCETK